MMTRAVMEEAVSCRLVYSWREDRCTCFSERIPVPALLSRWFLAFSPHYDLQLHRTFVPCPYARSSASLSNALCAIRVSRARSLSAAAAAFAHSGTSISISRGRPSGFRVTLRAMSASANGASASTSPDDKSTATAPKQASAKEVAKAASKKKDVYVDPEVVRRRREEKAAERKRKAEAEQADRARIASEGGAAQDEQPEATSAGFIKREFARLPLIGSEAEASRARPRKLKLMTWNVRDAKALCNAQNVADA